MELGGRHFCVSHAHPSDVERCHSIGQSVMLDNGAFSKWKSGKETNWNAYYAWCDQWLICPTTWAVVPDVIDGSIEEQDDLLAKWPMGKRKSSPVWHMNEPLARLCRLVESDFDRVCIGSTSEYKTVLSPVWKKRMDLVWNALTLTFGKTPPIHMLRGLQCCEKQWPFASVDSTDIARNHWRKKKSTRDMADRWDDKQCPLRWQM